MSKKPRKRDESHELVMELQESFNRNAFLNYEIKMPFQMNERHQEMLHLLQTNKTKMVFVDGPAGTAKTYIAVLAGLHLLKEHYIDQIYYIRSIVESASRQIGSLPGEIDDKFLPWSMPLIDKITEISGKMAADNLYKGEMIKGLPVNFCRGLTFNRALVIVDESQNLTKEELTTILTRFGHKSKYVIVGDTFQSDIKNSGFKDIYNAFNTEFSKENEIHCLKFYNEDIVRSQILKHIVRVLEAIPKSSPPRSSEQT
jgi:phosphate starvation-inducible PhoH-like protein